MYVESTSASRARQGEERMADSTTDIERKPPSGAVFNVHISGEGIQVTREIGQDRLLRVLAAVLGDAEITPRFQARPDEHTVGGPRTVHVQNDAATMADAPSIGEFLDELNISKNPERIAGIILYLKEHHSVQSVNRGELPQWFKRAGAPVPKNMPRDLNNAVKAKLISEDPDAADNYFVTATGERFLRQSAL